MYLPPDYHTEQLHHLKRVDRGQPLVPPQFLVNIHLFSVLIVLPFPETHVKEIIQHAAF